MFSAFQIQFLYFLGTIALCVAGFAVVFMKDTFLSTENGLLPVMKFYSELMSLIKDNGFKGILGSSALLVKALALVIYAGMLIALVINLLRAFGKLGWLFKRRASYANGFNRNAYAMDDLSKRFSGSLTSLIVCNLLVYLLTTTSEISILSFTLYGYATLGAGLALHFICGLIEGHVTLFTTGEKVEEEEREYGLFVFFVRNVIQLVAVGAILFLFLPFSTLKSGVTSLLDTLVVQKNFASLASVSGMKALLPFIVEVFLWIFLTVLIKHATAATEFNRDCLDCVGMRNFALFGFFTTLCLAGLALFPKIGTEGALVTKLLIAAGVAFVAFLLDCIIRPRHHGSYDEVDVDAYFPDNPDDAKYNNTII